MADLATARREAKWALDSFDAETGKPDFHAAELAHHLRLLLAASPEPAAATCDVCERPLAQHRHGGACSCQFCCNQPIPQPAVALSDEVREAAERADKAMCDVFGGVDQFGDYCGHPIMPAKLAHAVQDLLVALDAAHGGRP